MSYALTTTLRPQNTFFMQLASIFYGSKESYLRRKAYSQTVRELQNLSERQLLDIGVPSRGNIRDFAYESAYHKATP